MSRHHIQFEWKGKKEYINQDQRSTSEQRHEFPSKPSVTSYNDIINRPKRAQTLPTNQSKVYKKCKINSDAISTTTNLPATTILSCLQQLNHFENIITLVPKEGSQDDCDDLACGAINSIVKDVINNVSKCSVCGSTKEWYPLDDAYRREYDEHVQSGLISYDKDAVYAGICNNDSKDMGIYDPKKVDKKLHQIVNKANRNSESLFIASPTDILETKANKMIQDTEHGFAFTQAFKSKVISAYQQFEQITKVTHTKHVATLVAVMIFVCQTDQEEPTIADKTMFNTFKKQICKDQLSKIVSQTQSETSEAARIKEGQKDRLNDDKMFKTVRKYLTDIRKAIPVHLTHQQYIYKHWKSIRIQLQNLNFPANYIDTVEPLINELHTQDFIESLSVNRLYDYCCACVVIRLDNKKVHNDKISCKKLHNEIKCNYQALINAKKDIISHKNQLEHCTNLAIVSIKNSSIKQSLKSIQNIDF